MLSSCLFIFLGEAFRLGGQHTRCIGHEASYKMQIEASESHMRFITFIEKKYGVSCDIYINSYTTQYDNNIIDVYTSGDRNRLITATFNKTPIGLNNLWIDSLNDAIIDNYASITYMRIDLLLYPTFDSVYNLYWEQIMFPSICFIPHHIHCDDPRVSDVMIFVPAKYFYIIKQIKICHESWHLLIRENLSYADLDTMLPTFHDSDSAKDYNPIYSIVNRPISDHWHSEGKIFNKTIWPDIL